MKRVVSLFILAALGITLLAPVTPVSPSSALAQAPTVNNVQVLFALDVSGSMTRNKGQMDGYGRSQVDAGYGLSVSDTATDPEWVTFDAVATWYRWVNYLLQSRPELDDQLDVYGHVIAFDHNIYTKDMVRDETGQAFDQWLQLDTLSAPITLTPPALGPEPRNSDFIPLYEAADADFAEQPLGSNTRRVLVIITDSLPCNPDKNETPATRNMNGVRVYGFDCLTPQTMLNHLQVANQQLSSDVKLVVLHLTPNAQWSVPDEREGSLQEVHDVWEDSANRRGGRFVSVGDVHDLPYALFDALAEQLTLAAAGGIAVTPTQIQRTLGIIQTNNARFSLPPYQQTFDALIFATSGREFDITANDHPMLDQDYETLLSSNAGLVQLLRFNKPPAGDWAIRSADGTPIRLWLTYKAAKAELSWNAPEATQFRTASLVYRIVAPDGSSWIEPNYQPIITLTVAAPSGENIPLEINSCNRTQCESEPFFLLERGNYTVAVDVRPGDNWPRIENLLPPPQEDTEDKSATPQGAPTHTPYTFLTPTPPPPLQVQQLTFWRQVSYENGDTAIEPIPASRDIMPELSIARSEKLTVQVWAGDTGSRQAFPTSVTGELQYSNSDGCPSDTKMRHAQEELYSAPLQFEAEGMERSECKVTLALYVQSELKPLQGKLYTLYPALPVADVSVHTTTRLQIAYLDKNGEPITDIHPTAALESTLEQREPDFTMYDYQTMPDVVQEPPFVQWKPDSLTIEVAFLDEDSMRVVQPRYIGEESDTKAEEPSSSASRTEKALPLRLSIVNAQGEDVASEKDISIRQSDKPGIYTIEVRGLSPGNYRVQVELLMRGRDAPQLDEESFEYTYARDEEFTLSGINPTLIALLHVVENPYRRAQIYGAYALVGVLALLVGTSGARTYLRRVAPLSGSISIYVQRPSDAVARRVWFHDLPTNRNTVVFPTEDLLKPELAAALITEVKVTTKRKGYLAHDGGAEVEIKVGNQLKSATLPRARSSELFETDTLGTRYYVAKYTTTTPPEVLDVSDIG